MDDKSVQEDEISSLKSIYEEEDIFSFDESHRTGKFYIKFESDDYFVVKFLTEKTELKLKHLPPILIDFEFPPDYPSKSPPRFQLCCRWLGADMLHKLCLKLDELWSTNENCSILFTWISFLTYELFEFLSLDKNDVCVDTSEHSKSSDSRAVVQSCSPLLMENYNHDQLETKFLNSYFTCQVCFTEKCGKQCMRFHKCEHVFCNECMKGYFETLIADGNVKNLTCPHDKCESQALPNQVLSLVGIETFNRYDTLLLKDSLNNMADIVYCPRVECQCAVIPEDTLARCPDCQYVFCSMCRQGYHGVEPCKINDAQVKNICEMYLNGDEATKAKLEKQYGEKRIKRAIENSLSMQLITDTSKQCPNCKSWLQKLDGCNKMTCSKCNSYFCWLCLSKLPKVDPYAHFNLLSSECYMKLFEGEIQPNENQNDNENPNNNNNNDIDANVGADNHLQDLDFELAQRLNIELNAGFEPLDDAYQREDDDDDDEFILFYNNPNNNNQHYDTDDEDH